MSIPSFLENPALAGALVTLAMQWILVSLLWLMILLPLRKKSAPVRSLISSGGMAALFLILGASIIFRLSGIAWRSPVYPAILAKAPSTISKLSFVSADRTFPAGAVPWLTERAIEERGMIRSSIPYQATDKTIKIVNFIGLAWVAGFLFLLLRLGYGLIFLKGFRFGLVRVEDAKIEVLMKSVAGSFKQRRAPELENKLAQDPQDIRARSLLLSFYFKKAISDRAYYAKHDESVLWLTQFHPDAANLCNPSGQIMLGQQYSSAMLELWQKHLQQKPDNLLILWNAGNSVLLPSIDWAIECLKKGRNLDPINAEYWDSRLGNAYRLKMIRYPKDTALAKASLDSFENAQAESTPRAYGNLLPNLGKAALAAGEFNKAADYASQMLATEAGKDNWNKGNLIYYGHFILGMLAVQKGDLDKVEKCLLAAGDTPGSPQLNSFGPNMSLAKELLDRGRNKTVLDFLKKCSKFWRSHDDRCNQWIQQIEQGQTPDFGGNLFY
jgi:tetratricopeptide (TPR) repeat protein